MSSMLSIPCPNCGKTLSIPDEQEHFICPHCASSFHLKSVLSQADITPIQKGRVNFAYKKEWYRAGDYSIFLHTVYEEELQDQRSLFVEVEYRNSSRTKNLSCRRNQWVMYDVDGFSYEAESSFGVNYTEDKPYFGGERFINPGMHARGWFLFKLRSHTIVERLQFFTAFLGTKSVDIILVPEE